MTTTPRYRTFGEFYPFYLREHTHPVCRRLHFVGTSLAVLLVIGAILSQHWGLLVAALLVGYAFAWVGHYFFEHNRPATFRYPLFSFMGDWRMWWDLLRGRLRMDDGGR